VKYENERELQTESIWETILTVVMFLNVLGVFMPLHNTLIMLYIIRD
jgi:hypothetical protein